jgi:hypothetical protein
MALKLHCDICDKHSDTKIVDLKPVPTGRVDESGDHTQVSGASELGNIVCIHSIRTRAMP